MEAEFERKYEKELAAIESGIVSIYDDNPQMADYSVMEALDNLIRFYEAEAVGRTASIRRMEPLDQEIYQTVKAVCERLLHKAKSVNASEQEIEVDEFVETVKDHPENTLEEVIACLKRIRKSVTRWNKANGRRGYLGFVQQYL
jgi:hypothetical protein